MGRLYLVDDHVMVRQALIGALSSRGHEILGESADPTHALADVQKLHPQVLLLDLYLGVRSGFELLAEVQKRRLPTRVVVLTMAGYTQHVAEAIRLGASAYVLKESSLDDLLCAVDKALLGVRHFDGQVADLMARALESTEGDALAALSGRERQVLMMVVRGHSSAQIGQVLHLSSKTVDSYRSRLMGKLGVSDLPALVRFAIRNGLMHADES